MIVYPRNKRYLYISYAFWLVNKNLSKIRILAQIRVLRIFFNQQHSSRPGRRWVFINSHTSFFISIMKIIFMSFLNVFLVNTFFTFFFTLVYESLENLLRRRVNPRSDTESERGSDAVRDELKIRPLNVCDTKKNYTALFICFFLWKLFFLIFCLL